MQEDKISPSDFVGKVNPLINTLIREPKWRDIIGSKYIESLTKLSINLNTLFLKTYIFLNQLGDAQNANHELNNLEVIATQIINEIGSVIENSLSLRSNPSDTILGKEGNDINQTNNGNVHNIIQVFVSPIFFIYCQFYVDNDIVDTDLKKYCVLIAVIRVLHFELRQCLCNQDNSL